jgi:hypothetical protein
MDDGRHCKREHRLRINFVAEQRRTQVVGQAFYRQAFHDEAECLEEALCVSRQNVGEGRQPFFLRAKADGETLPGSEAAQRLCSSTEWPC